MQRDVHITGLLREWQAGDQNAGDRLFDLVYSNLHQVASRILQRDRQRFVIQPTELINECVIRLIDLDRLKWRDRIHFMGVVGESMRRALVDEARRQNALKRSGVEITFVSDRDDPEQHFNLIDLDTALNDLGKTDPHLSRIVELKYFAGLTNAEVAEMLETSESTIKRSWRAARAWLLAELSS